MLLVAELRTPAWTRKVAGSKVACLRGAAGEVPAGGDPRATLSCRMRRGHGRGKDTQRGAPGSPGLGTAAVAQPTLSGTQEALRAHPEQGRGDCDAWWCPGTWEPVAVVGPRNPSSARGPVRGTTLSSGGEGPSTRWPPLPPACQINHPRLWTSVFISGFSLPISRTGPPASGVGGDGQAGPQKISSELDAEMTRPRAGSVEEATRGLAAGRPVWQALC